MRPLHLLALLPSLAFAQGTAPAPRAQPPPPPVQTTPPPGQPAQPPMQQQPSGELPPGHPPVPPEARGQGLPPGHPPVQPGPEGQQPGTEQQQAQPLVGPAACVVRALNETMLDDYDAMLLCQGAASSRPVDCYKQASQHTFMEKHQLLTLCSPSLSAGGGLVGYRPSPSPGW